MQSNPPKTHLPSLLQFAFSGLGFVGALTAAAALLLAGVMSFGSPDDPSQTVSIFSLAAVALLVGFLLAPGGALALLRLLGKAPPPWSQALAARGLRPARLATLALILWPLVVLAGSGAGRVPALAWLLLPPLLILAIGIPIWWVYEYGRRGLPVGSAQRAWGLLGFGLIITPAVVMLVELIILVLVALLAVLWLSTQPGLARELSAILERFRDPAAADPQALLEALGPYIRRPGFVAGALAVGALALPLVEELLKPLPLWLFAGRRLSPAEGFTGGLLCGAAFALIESLGFSANALTTGFPAVAIARLGTGLLHAVTSGLVGWGLATAFTRRQWARAFLALVLAVALHGLWNLFGLLLGLSGLPGGLQGLPDLPARLAVIAPLAMGVLVAALLAILFGANRLLSAETYPYKGIQ